jgi:arsenite methyltransferase
VSDGRTEPDALRGPVLDGAQLEHGDDVLDLGDGSGFLAADVRAQIGDGWVYAIARDVGTLEELLQNAHALGISGVAYLVGDAEVLPLPDLSVDAVVGTDALSSAADAETAAGELYRVLRPGGRVSLFESGARVEPATTLRDVGFLDVAVAAVGQPDAETAGLLVTARKP